jgi:hypothetical protein
MCVRDVCLIISSISSNVRSTFLRYVRRAHTHTHMYTFYFGGAEQRKLIIRIQAVEVIFLELQQKSCLRSVTQHRSFLQNVFRETQIIRFSSLIFNGPSPDTSVYTILINVQTECNCK